MSRITKQIAEAVANQLVLPKRQELQKEEQKLHQITTDIYLKHIPSQVMDAYDKYHEWFNKTESVYLNTNGFNYEYLALTKNYPKQRNKYPEFTAAESAKIRVQFDIVADLKKSIEKLKFDIETAVFNLRTYSNVEKEFPEAFKLLPAKQTTALIVNLKDIRCQLDKANC